MQAHALLPHHDRSDVGVGGVFDEMIDGIAAEDLNSLALHDFCNGCAELHADPSQSGRYRVRPVWKVVGTEIGRSVKRVRGGFREALISRVAFRRAQPLISDEASRAGSALSRWPEAALPAFLLFAFAAGAACFSLARLRFNASIRLITLPADFGAAFAGRRTPLRFLLMRSISADS